MGIFREFTVVIFVEKFQVLCYESPKGVFYLFDEMFQVLKHGISLDTFAFLPFTTKKHFVFWCEKRGYWGGGKGLFT